MNNPYQAYQDNAVITASPGELTLMLYNGCLKFINLAKEAMKTNDIAMKNTNIQKAQKIITELMVTLKPEYEISKNVMALYEYIHRRLIEANIHNDLAILEECEAFVTEFRDTWKQVIQLHRQQQYKQGGQI